MLIWEGCILIGPRLIVKIVRLAWEVRKHHIHALYTRRRQALFLRSAMRASRSSHRVSIECGCILTTFNQYIFIFASCKFRYVVSEKLSRLSSKVTLTFRLTRFLVLKLFSKPPSYDPSRVQGTGDSVTWVITEGTCLTKCATMEYPNFIYEEKR